ncbi:hypothetical protein T484DRAFT_1903536 [Baffinella frigidus]|nr:hypothetical protein T484DRAFT_1903536 [Cryptophyta sp. CCMP2293]
MALEGRAARSGVFIVPAQELSLAISPGRQTISRQRQEVQGFMRGGDDRSISPPKIRMHLPGTGGNGSYELRATSRDVDPDNFEHARKASRASPSWATGFDAGDGFRAPQTQYYLSALPISSSRSPHRKPPGGGGGGDGSPPPHPHAAPTDSPKTAAQSRQAQNWDAVYKSTGLQPVYLSKRPDRYLGASKGERGDSRGGVGGGSVSSGTRGRVEVEARGASPWSADGSLDIEDTPRP